MNNARYESVRKPLRLWPAVVIVLLMLFLRFVLPIFVPEALFYGFFATVIGTVLILLWWLFFSRAAWKERIGAVALMALAIFLTHRFFLHESIKTGAMGMLFFLLGSQTVALAFVLWAVVTKNLSNPVRRATMVLTILLACGAWTLLRTGGFSSGDFDHDFAWRWSPTHEERFLAELKNQPAPGKHVPAPVKREDPAPQTIETSPQEAAPEPSATQTAAAEQDAVTPEAMKESDSTAISTPEREAEWPGFRGPNRDSIVKNVQIDTDWSTSPPKELWRRSIGPGWSSFAVRGDHIYTQEQRGEDELVTCYSKSTGEPIWDHRDAARFWESNAGPGPRGTPTIHDGRVYAFGATGILNVLNADDGTKIWSRDAASDAKAQTPGWGFASSPLVVGDVVIVGVSGQLVAYDRQTGKPRWFGRKGGADYTSPHQITIAGVPQILFLNRHGAMSVEPASGKLLWEYKLPSGTRIVQPAMTASGDLLLTDGDSHGLRSVEVQRAGGKWNVKEQWSTIGLKPNFNDFVAHKGFAYGFDGSFLSCIDLQKGERKWKGGRYGAGQLLLLADQDVLLIVGEKGDLALVKASSDQFTELARVPAIQGKTWNHPVLVNDVLLVRNGEEMAAFRLKRP